MTYEISNLLQVPESFYALIFDALPGNHVLVKNDQPRFTILTATPECLTQNRFTQEAIAGKSFFEVFQAPKIPAGKDELLASFLHVSQKREPHFLPVRRHDLKAADGNLVEKYWRISNQPVYSPNGEVAYIINTTADITSEISAENTKKAHDELQQSYQTLAESEQRFRALVNATSNVVYRMNADWSEMHELQGRDFLSDTLEPIRDWQQKYIHPDERLRVREAINKAVSTKSTFELEHQVFDQDGKLSWTFSRAAPLLDAHGNVYEWFGAASDITQRKLSEQMMLQTEARYQTLFEAMDQGFCVLGMMFDQDNRPIDYRFLEANPVLQIKPV